MLFEKMHERRLQVRAVVRSKFRSRLRRRVQQVTRSTPFKITLATVKIIASIVLPAWDLYSVEDRPAKQPKKPSGLIEDIPLMGDENGVRRRRSWEDIVEVEGY